jgi:predicted secreted acid phosphatase
MTKKLINTVFLDIDDTISNFYIEDDAHKTDKDKWNREGFTKFVNRQGFEHLPMREDAHLLIRYLRNSGVQVVMLTSAGKSWGARYDEIRRQKLFWLHKNKIDWPCIVVHKKEDKKDYATPDSILIDDTKQNCEQFEESGGYSIHHKTALQTILKLNKKYDLRGN